MKLIRAIVVRDRYRTDQVSIETDLLEGLFPYTTPLYLTFAVARGQAELYLKVNFPDVLFHVIDTSIERLQRKNNFTPRSHTTSCATYGNYKPPYHDCTCGAEMKKFPGDTA